MIIYTFRIFQSICNLYIFKLYFKLFGRLFFKQFSDYFFSSKVNPNRDQGFNFKYFK